MKTLWWELSNAVRGLRRTPGFTMLVVAVLGVGLGGTIYMFGAIKGYIMEPLPFPESAELMHLEANNLAEGDESLEVYPLDFLVWREQQQSFTDLAGFYMGTVNLSGAGAERPERFDGAFITGNAFDVLQTQAYLGRTLVERDSEVGAPDVVLLGYATWMHRYNGDPGIVGKIVRVNGQDATVVGVMPRYFAFPVNQDVWVPLRIDTTALKSHDAGASLEVFGRLKANTTREQAVAELNAIAGRLAQQFPDTNDGVGVAIKPYADEYMSGGVRISIYTMFGAVVLVLIMACANTANLILVRAVRRGRELAIRSALGASRRRLVGRVLAECFILAMLATGLGCLLADWGGRAMMHAMRTGNAVIPFWVNTSWDWRDITFALGAAVFVTLLAGLLPALRGTQVNVNKSLKDGGGGSAGTQAGRLSRGLVVFEIALSCVLLVSAGLMLRSLVNLDQRDFGANTHNILIGRMGLFEEQYPTPESRNHFFQTLSDKLASRPGVLQAAVTTGLPGASGSDTEYAVRGRGLVGEFASRDIYFGVATPGFFDLLQIPLLQGRLYDQRDRTDTEPVVVVTRRFAESVWPGENAIGRQIALEDSNDPTRYRTVIGVVENFHLAAAGDETAGAVMLPMSQNPVRFAYAAVRTPDDPLTFGNEFRDIVFSLDADIPVYWLQTLDYWIGLGNWAGKLVAVNFQIFGVIALLLATTGLYGVLSYSVAQRTREIGVRRALGADNRRVLHTMARESLWQLGIGLGIGLVLALGFGQLMAGLLFDVRPWDPLTYAGVLIILALVTVCAAAVPTLRALRINPTEALRYE